MRYEYKVGGETVVLESDDDYVAVRFDDRLPRSRRAMSANACGTSFSDRVELENERFTIVAVMQRSQPRAIRALAAMSGLKADSAVVRTAAVFKLPDGHAVATERVLVGLKDSKDDGSWLRVGNSARTVEKIPTGESEFVVTLPPEEDPLDVASVLARDPRTEWAEPDFVTVRTRLSRDVSPNRRRRTDDPLVSSQYAVRLTGASEAWEIQEGRRSVVVAVLDEGVDTRHEDLRDAIVASYDSIDDDDFQEPNSWDGHGTACAGLAIATGSNGRGVRGIASGCSGFAVRMAQSLQPDGPWQTSIAKIARAIDWSWRKGAWVLSNSWGGGVPSNHIAAAIARARTQGRGGKGAVVVIAAGNDDGPVEFPATLPGIIAVAASNEYDEPKTKHSRDGESWWGSGFGPEIAVSAPGVHNYTTDITGASGYNSGGGIDSNYSSDFNGTSSATPIVAGAAAMVLSANPQLSEADVRAILVETADKVGGVRYVDGRNDRMGHGRINVLKAVRLAKSQA